MAYREPTAEEVEQCKIAAAAVANLPGVVVEITGAWVWAWGNTYPYRELFRQLGWGRAPAKKKMYWHPKSVEYKGNIKTYARIREEYGVVTPQERRSEEDGV